MKKTVIALLILACGPGAFANSTLESPETMDAKEVSLAQIAQTLNSSSNPYTLKSLSKGNTTLTTWEVISEGKTIANLKCQDGNTRPWAEYSAYKLGRLLDSPMYPVVSLIDIQSQALSKKMVDGLRSLPPSPRLNGHLQSGFYGKTCALKEWAAHKGYNWYGQRHPKDADFSERTTFLKTSAEKTRLANYLTCRNGADGRSTFNFQTGKGEAIGTGDFMETAKDFSNMMLIDVLISNKDRFPGGNIAVRQVGDEWKLFSLDNGAGGDASMGEWSYLDMARFLRRFDKGMLQRLRMLGQTIHSLPEFRHSALQGRAASFAQGIEFVLNHAQDVSNGTVSSKYSVANIPDGCASPFIGE